MTEMQVHEERVMNLSLIHIFSIADHEKVSQMEGVRLIGHITKPELGCALITRDGQELSLIHISKPSTRSGITNV